MTIDLENPYWEKQAASLPKEERQMIYRAATEKAFTEAIELARKGYTFGLEDKIDEFKRYARKCGMSATLKVLKRKCYAEILNQELQRAEEYLGSLKEDGLKFRMAINWVLRYAAKAKENVKEKVKQLFKTAMEKRIDDAKAYTEAGKTYLIPIVFEDVKRYAKAAGIAVPKSEYGYISNKIEIENVWKDKDFLIEKCNQLKQKLDDQMEKFFYPNYFFLFLAPALCISLCIGHVLKSPLIVIISVVAFFAGCAGILVWKILAEKKYDSIKNELKKFEDLISRQKINF